MTTEKEKDELWRKYRDEIEELKQKHDKTDGVALIGIFEQLRTSYETYYENFLELHKLLEDYREIKISIKLWDIEGQKSDLARKYLKKVSRSLFNYLASASTLADHTMIITKAVCKKYGSQELKESYQEKIHPIFVDRPLANFIKDFRNFCLHVRTPPLKMSFALRDPPSLKIFFVKKHLLDWDGWLGQSPAFIDAMKDQEELLEIVYEYSKIVHEFYEWYGKEFVKVFAKQYQEVDELRDRVNRKTLERNRIFGIEVP